MRVLTRGLLAIAMAAFSAAALLALLTPSPAIADEPPRLTVVVLVVDSLMPDELGQPFPHTPNLTFLRDSGTSYGQSRAVFSAETIPNHVAMMTGMLPENSGIAVNSYWNRSGEPAASDLSLPSALEATTLFTRLRDACPSVRTAAALSKNYLYEIFSECGYSGSDCGINVAPGQSSDPTADPTYIEPSGHSPDLATMQHAQTFLPDADFLFINLGDVDRTGHIDETGASGMPALRYAALLDTDTLVGQLVDDLDAAGRWDSTVIFLVSDHGMDWSTPDKLVNLGDTIGDGLFAVQNGGTGNIYVVDPADPQKHQKLAAARAGALMQEGVEFAWYREPNPLDAGEDTLIPAQLGARHPNIGDLVVVARQGWRISEPSQSSNPLPGNHGHTATFQNTFIISGGLLANRIQAIGDPAATVDPLLKLDEQSENIDVAPTVAWLFGIDGSDMDGRVLGEAFATGSSPSACGVIVDSDDDGEPDYSDPCPAIAGGTGCSCTPAPAEGCRQALSANAGRLAIKGDSVNFNLKNVEATALGEFRDSSNALSLCLYSQAGGSARPIGELRMPFDQICDGEDCWSEIKGAKLKYANEAGTPDGVEKALLVSGDDGRVRIQVRAHTDSIATPPYDAPVRAQLQSAGGGCWEARFEDAGIKHNDETRFDARSAAPE